MAGSANSMMALLVAQAEAKGADMGTLRALIEEASAEAAPPGVRVNEIGGGLRLSGKGLGQRMLREPALRWLVERVK